MRAFALDWWRYHHPAMTFSRWQGDFFLILFLAVEHLIVKYFLKKRLKEKYLLKIKDLGKMEEEATPLRLVHFSVIQLCFNSVKRKILNKDQSFKAAKVSCFGAWRMLTTLTMTSHLMELSTTGQTSEERLNDQKEHGTQAVWCHL